MRRYVVVFGILVGVLTGIPVIAIAYLGGQLAGLPFFPFDLFEMTTRVLPGALVTAGIDVLIKIIMALHIGPLSQTAKVAEEILALLQFIAIAAIFGAVVALVARRMTRQQIANVAVTGAAILFLVTLLVEAAMGFPAAGPLASVVWLVLVYGGWAVAVGWLLRKVLSVNADEPAARPANRTRRDLLYLGGSAVVALAAAAVGLGEALRSSGTEGGNGSAAVPEAAPEPSSAHTGAQTGPTTTPVPPLSTGMAASPPQATLAARISPAPGTRPELTQNADFYRIDIDLLPPRIDASTWKLVIDGLVQKPMTLTLDQIRSRPAVSQYVTMSCISNPLGGELISTSLWTGTRLKDLLLEVGLKPGTKELYIEAADGFYESLYQEDMGDERTLLVYEMNGAPLAVEHGFPLRIYIPNRYGMKQPKWITHLQVLDRVGPGYWVDRGWSAQAIPQTTAAIDGATTKSVDPKTKSIPFGGIAWAGARGISKVEVQVDNGPWNAAQLRNLPLSPLTWVQWRYDWMAQAGNHVVAVRAYDGQGKLQSLETRPEHPDGATGIFSIAFKV